MFKTITTILAWLFQPSGRCMYCNEPVDEGEEFCSDRCAIEAQAI